LRDLLSDSRACFADIAKKCGVSKNAVWNRVKEMEKKEIITGATVQVNFKNLGYDCVASLLLQVEPSKSEEIKEVLEKIPDVFGPFSSTSKYNLRIVVTLKDICELEHMKENLRRKLSITEIASSIWTDVWLIPENLSLLYEHLENDRIFEKTPVDHEKSRVSLSIDEVDFLMIRELARESRISFRKLALQLGVSTDTISRRYEKLRTSGIIVPRIQINLEKIGYQATALFALKLTLEANASVIIKKISQIPDIFYIMESAGNDSIGAMLMVKDTKELLKTGDLISKIKGVHRLETTIQSLTKSWPIARTYTSKA
jgi:Lrp/AsnC family transcriptional regulator, regulator for asnA, asnC and gidA